ncbi:hypothetical protein CDCA_CDCA01G0214 [Cyanidium caldarium]|uniref:DNA mismatch repair protein MutL n=1 Tax=Cyanidium caldarium TaxID=2771 RepID=A0AAV9IPL4_CYACA|nr:hypothetical protein CDCA_CDCA01G0214 [Cyanidium caldarium]
MRVSRLPLEVIQRIASGEVVDSHRAVVRELVENALDAGARQIQVHVRDGGRELLVVDDGGGMDAADLEASILLNTTSKLCTLEQLVAGQVGTLGFRGQALWAIAHRAAAVHIRSMVSGAPHGHELRTGLRDTSDGRNGMEVSVHVVAAVPGTMVRVCGLFEREPLPLHANRSARLDADERRQLVQFIEHTALAHPQTSWRVHWDGCEKVRLFATLSDSMEPATSRSSSASRDVFVQVFGIAPAHLVSASGPVTDGMVECVVALPEHGHHRARPDHIVIAINGRVVQTAALTQAVMQALRRCVPPGRYPMCWVQVRCSGAFVDWNVHPMKTQVRLHDERRWAEAVQGTLQQAMALRVGQPIAGWETSMAEPMWRQLWEHRRVDAPWDTPTTENEADEMFSAPLWRLRVVAQLQRTYIVAEEDVDADDTGGGVWLIEQHVAHERALYDELQREREQIVQHTRALPQPLRLHGPFTAAERRALRDALGLHIAECGPLEWRLERVPERVWQWVEAEPSASRSQLTQLVRYLQLADGMEQCLATVACRLAVRNGTALSVDRMQRLVDAWVRSRMPRTCPHGRPIFWRISAAELARRFRRRYRPLGNGEAAAGGGSGDGNAEAGRRTVSPVEPC